MIREKLTKLNWLSLCLTLFLMWGGLACNDSGSSEGAESSGNLDPAGSSNSEQTNGQDITQAQFEVSSFSSLVEFSTDQNWIRFDYDFFPAETRFNPSENNIQIPCTTNYSVPEGVAISLNLPEEETESFCFTLSTEDKNAVYQDYHLAFPFNEGVFGEFNSDFGLEITVEGVRSGSDQFYFTPSGSDQNQYNLEHYYRLKLERDNP